MSTLDIRTAGVAPTQIRFSDRSDSYHKPDVLINVCGKGIDLKDTGGDRTMRIMDKEHADNLRKALDKAEELGWLK